MTDAPTLTIVRIEDDAPPRYSVPVFLEGTKWCPAPDLEELAQAIFERFPGEFPWAAIEPADVPSFSIGYLWKASGGSSKGMATFGRATIPSGLTEYFSPHDVVVWLAADHVRDMRFTPDQVEALLYHELRHITEDDETGEPLLVPHEFEGFAAEIEHYGVWRPGLGMRDVVFAAQQAEQLELPF